MFKGFYVFMVLRVWVLGVLRDLGVVGVVGNDLGFMGLKAESWQVLRILSSWGLGSSQTVECLFWFYHESLRGSIDMLIHGVKGLVHQDTSFVNHHCRLYTYQWT